MTYSSVDKESTFINEMMTQGMFNEVHRNHYNNSVSIH